MCGKISIGIVFNLWSGYIMDIRWFDKDVMRKESKERERETLYYQKLIAPFFSWFGWCTSKEKIISLPPLYSLLPSFPLNCKKRKVSHRELKKNFFLSLYCWAKKSYMKCDVEIGTNWLNNIILASMNKSLNLFRILS